MKLYMWDGLGDVRIVESRRSGHGSFVRSGVRSLCKPYVEDEERRLQDHLLEESNLSQLVLERKACCDHAKGIQVRSIDLLSSDVCFPNEDS